MQISFGTIKVHYGPDSAQIDLRKNKDTSTEIYGDRKRWRPDWSSSNIFMKIKLISHNINKGDNYTRAICK